MVSLPELKLWEILTLLYILSTQPRIGRKDLEHLVRKIRSVHLMGPGEVAHLYNIQHALSQ